MTRQEAINNHCKECIYDDGAMGSGTWRKQVTDCTATKCFLYPFRPVDSAEKAIKTKDKIANFSESELKAYKRKQEEFKLRVRR